MTSSLDFDDSISLGALYVCCICHSSLRLFCHFLPSQNKSGYLIVDLRTGAEKLAENGIVPEEDGTLLITRTLSEAGKSVCRINGSTVTVGMLKEIAEDMIDIYGQHEHQSLLNPVKHIRLLDRFCGAGFGEAMEEYKNSRQRLKGLEKQLAILIGDESQREQRMDMLLFQKEEIEAAELQEGEEDALLEQKKRLSSMERLIRLTGESVTLLYDGDDRAPSACDQLGDALAKLQEAAEYDLSLIHI